MSSDSPLPTSPEPVVVTPDIEAASEQLQGLGETWESVPARDPATGKFVKKDEVVTQDVTPEPVAEVVEEAVEEVEEAPAEEGEPEAESEVEEPEAPSEFKVVLKGQAERGEEDIELVLPDAEAVERWNREVNNGLRKKDYDAKMQAVAAERAEIAEFNTALEHNPIGTMLNAIPKQTQVDVALALVAEHWDELFPTLQAYSQDVAGVYKTRLQSRDAAQQADVQARRVMEGERKAAEILTAVEALVPDSVAENIRARFRNDAERDLVELANRGVAISPAVVQSLLQDRIKMYGFGVDPVKPAKAAVARRVGQPDSAKPTPDIEKAKQVQARIQQTQTARKNAAAIPPAGRGPVATRKTLVPKGADIEAASDALSKADSWAAFRPI
jgi:hypothetical protein